MCTSYLSQPLYIELLIQSSRSKKGNPNKNISNSSALNTLITDFGIIKWNPFKKSDMYGSIDFYE